jgi:cytochrome c peroxidase
MAWFDARATCFRKIAGGWLITHDQLALLTRIFKTPSVRGIRHTAPYFHDNSAKFLEELAEHYTFFFENFVGITLTKQDEADIVAFLKLL